MSAHTKEPWRYVETSDCLTIGKIGCAIARIRNDVSGRPINNEDRSNARRIVACVNVCANIETEVLEQHPLGVISADFSMMKQQRDKLMEALEQIDSYRITQFMGPYDMALACVTTARAALAKVKP